MPEYKQLLDAAGRPSVHLLPVMITCLPAGDDTTLQRFNTIAEQAKAFVVLASQRRNSAIQLGKVKDQFVVESWIKQHKITEAACLYVQAYLEGTGKQDQNAVMSKDEMIKFVKDIRREVLLYSTFIQNTNSNFDANKLKATDEEWKDAKAACEEAIHITKHLDALYLGCWHKFETKKRIEMNESLKAVVKGENATNVFFNVKDKKSIIDTLDSDVYEKEMQAIAVACQLADTSVKRITGFIDGYDECDYVIPTPDNKTISMGTFAANMQTFTARMKAFICAGALLELVVDEIPSFAERKTEAEKQKAEILANIDEARAPFPSRLLLILDAWTLTGDVEDALKQVSKS